MLNQQQIESQLASRRLDVEEIKRQLKELSNAIVNINKSITDIRDNIVNNIVVTGAASEGYQIGDTFYHKLKHIFNKTVTFIVTLVAPSITVVNGAGHATVTMDAPLAYNAGTAYYEAGTYRWYAGRLNTTSNYHINDGSTNNSIIQCGLGNKLGFFNAAPIVKQTLNGYTTNGQTVVYTGITNANTGAVFAQVADLNVLRVAYENLRASYDDIRTKLQTTTLVG